MRSLPALLMLICATAFLAQSPSRLSDGSAARAALDRKIELMIRSRFSVPADCEISFGPRMSSIVAGFDKITVTLLQAGKRINVDFLISRDNKTLARMDEFDLDSNPALSIDVDGRPIRGNPTAPVTIVSFDDLECPVCAREHQILPEILGKYGDAIRVIYKDNPLIDLHPWALHAAVNAGCLVTQDGSAYWSFVDYVHTHAFEVTGETRQLDRAFATLDHIAADEGRKAKLNTPALEACLKRQDDTPVRQSMKEAQGLGLNFAPALFVNGEELRGLSSPQMLSNAIDRALRESQPAASEEKRK